LPIVLSASNSGIEQAPQGTLYRAPPVFHVQTHHYCYPDVGIEMPLGSLPVVECNRWEPEPAASGVDARIEAYEAEVRAWAAARASEASEAAATEQLIAASMALTPDLIACQFCGNRFEEAELDIEMRCGLCRSHLPSPSKESP